MGLAPVQREVIGEMPAIGQFACHEFGLEADVFALEKAPAGYPASQMCITPEGLVRMSYYVMRKPLNSEVLVRTILCVICVCKEIQQRHWVGC